jgi:hypothetical protein
VIRSPKILAPKKRAQLARVIKYKMRRDVSTGCIKTTARVFCFFLSPARCFYSLRQSQGPRYTPNANPIKIDNETDNPRLL